MSRSGARGASADVVAEPGVKATWRAVARARRRGTDRVDDNYVRVAEGLCTLRRVADQPDPEPLRALERQVEHGNLFVHAALSEQASRANQIEAVVNGLADLLVRLDVVSTDDLVDSVETTRTSIA